MTGARHVEVQIIADGHGTVWAVGVRDCTLQRRNQKVIEESHCVALTPNRTATCGPPPCACRGRRLPERRDGGVPVPARGALFAFLEVNTRLQVEHPVTELTTASTS